MKCMHKVIDSEIGNCVFSFSCGTCVCGGGGEVGWWGRRRDTAMGCSVFVYTVLHVSKINFICIQS